MKSLEDVEDELQDVLADLNSLRDHLSYIEGCSPVNGPRMKFARAIMREADIILANARGLIIEAREAVTDELNGKESHARSESPNFEPIPGKKGWQ